MKKSMLTAVAALLMTTASFAQTKQDTTHKHQHQTTAAKKYTCTMHPEVVMSKPGKCPKCGMDLVAVKPKKSTKPMGKMKM